VFHLVRTFPITLRNYTIEMMNFTNCSVKNNSHKTILRPIVPFIEQIRCMCREHVDYLLRNRHTLKSKLKANSSFRQLNKWQIVICLSFSKCQKSLLWESIWHTFLSIRCDLIRCRTPLCSVFSWHFLSSWSALKNV